LTADHLGSTRVLTDGSGTVVARHDYLPFGEEIVSSNRTAALFYTSDNLAQKFTGKERDAETGLDFFGARYMSSAQGRFTSPDPKQMTGRHLMNPQKWNKYVYVQNNPLTSIDPDGLDDYKIFITDSRGGGGNWAGAKSAAATTKNYNAAVSDPNSRVVFVGHTSHDPNTLKTTAVTLGDMGRSAGANSVQSVLGPPDASGVRNAEEVALPTTTVSANTIALFGCQSIDLASQYPGTNFIGMDSGTGQPGEAPVSSLQAMGAAAAAFVTADAAARPANGQPSANATDPVTAANQAFQQNKRKEDLDGDKVRRP
jgi:RHS repeat-associated protein